ncbi:MAG: hypothetical protein WCO78_05085 [Candidatus Roizmanbacteria bacterium]
MDEIPVLHPHRNIYRVIIVAIMVGLCGLGLFLVRRAQTNGFFTSPSTSASTERVVSVPSVAPVSASKAFFAVKSDSDLLHVYAGREVALSVYGDSGGRSVQGFDALVKMTGVDYEVVSAKSTTFDLIKFKKPTHLTLTAVKKINITRELALAPSDMVIQLVIKPLSDGALTPEIVESVGKETSKMIFDDITTTNGLEKVSATAQ